MSQFFKRQALLLELSKLVKLNKDAKLLPNYKQKFNLNVPEFVGFNLLRSRFGFAQSPEEIYRIAFNLNGNLFNFILFI